jgi:hypothetical protein
MNQDKQNESVTSMSVNCSYQKMVPIEQLVEHPSNANKHPEKQIEMLAKIMNYQGWRHPIVVSNLSGHIVAGHGRLAAAKKLGWTECPVDTQDFEDKIQEIAFLYSDNKIAELAEHDDEMFKLEALNLQLDVNGFDLDLLGVPDLVIGTPEINELDEKSESDKAQEFKVEVLCVNGEEMTALVDELSGRGMIAKAIFRG